MSKISMLLFCYGFLISRSVSGQETGGFDPEVQSIGVVKKHIISNSLYTESQQDNLAYDTDTIDQRPQEEEQIIEEVTNPKEVELEDPVVKKRTITNRDFLEKQDEFDTENAIPSLAISNEVNASQNSDNSIDETSETPQENSALKIETPHIEVRSMVDSQAFPQSPGSPDVSHLPQSSWDILALKPKKVHYRLSLSFHEFLMRLKSIDKSTRVEGIIDSLNAQQLGFNWNNTFLGKGDFTGSLFYRIARFQNPSNFNLAKNEYLLRKFSSSILWGHRLRVGLSAGQEQRLFLKRIGPTLLDFNLHNIYATALEFQLVLLAQRKLRMKLHASLGYLHPANNTDFNVSPGHETTLRFTTEGIKKKFYFGADTYYQYRKQHTQASKNYELEAGLGFKLGIRF